MDESLSMDQIFIRKLTEIVLAHLSDENFNVEELVKEAGLSSSTIHRRLRSLTNKSISQFIREIRLNSAMEMLQKNMGTISEVAYKTGFGSPTYFNKCFHEFFGYPPGKVKKGDYKSPEEAISSPVNSKKLNRSAWRTFILSSAGIILLTIIGYLVSIVFLQSSSGTVGSKTKYSEKSVAIAILPIINTSSSETDKYIFEGIIQGIFNNLRSIQNVRIISGAMIEKYRNSTEDLSEIGKKLGVSYIIEVAGQKTGNNIDYEYQLTEVSSNKKHGSMGVLPIRNTLNIFLFQRYHAQHLAEFLRVIITSEEEEKMEIVHTIDTLAYYLYLKAIRSIEDYEKTKNKSSFNSAVQMYHTAFGIDSAFAWAYSGLALAYYSRYCSEPNFKDEFLDSCLVLASTAISFDNLLDEAYYVKGLCHQVYGQYKEALDNFDKALKINPNYTLAYIQKGNLLLWDMHDYVMGLENLNKALNLSNDNERPSLLDNLGTAYLNLGFMDKAKYYFKEALTLNKDTASYLRNLAWIEFGLENFHEALNLDRKAYDIDSTFSSDHIIYFPKFYSIEEAYQHAKKLDGYVKRSGKISVHDIDFIGSAFGRVGKREEARYYFNQLDQVKYSEDVLKISRDIAHNKIDKYDLAVIISRKGNREKTYKYLDEYIGQSFFGTPELSLIKNDPMLFLIKNDDLYKRIQQDMETKHQAEHERVSKWLKKTGQLN